jgi:ABC-type sugar transport system permease subunit
MTGLNRIHCAWRRNRSEWLTFVAFVTPGLFLFAVFTYWPIVYSAYLSLTRWNLPAPTATFVGLDNYSRLFQDESFWQVLANTVVYTVCVVTAAQVLAFALALMLNQRVKGRTFFRALAFTPYITTTAAAALAWILLLDPRLGPLSFLYNLTGTEGPHWLASSSLALWAIVLVGIWRETGFAALFFLAGLQGLPRECFESARIDGASRWAMLRHITLPLMTPVIFFLSITGTIAAVKMFDTVAIMTEGGPVYPASSTYVYHLYRVGFRDFQMGYASAFAVVFFGLTMAFAVAQFRAAERWVYGGD